MRCSQAVVLVGTVIVAGACATTVQAPPPPVSAPAGSVTMDWTIDGAKDPQLCGMSSATTFNVVLVDSTGTPAGQWVQGCAAFAATIEGLSPGAYTGTANLVAPNGAGLTTAVQIPRIDVLNGGSSVIAVEFPRSSFF